MLASSGRLLAVRWIVLSALQSLALKAFKSELLRQQHVALDKAALGREAPLLYALSVCAELLNIDRTGILNQIPATRIASGYLEASERIELGALLRAEMRAQQLHSPAFNRAPILAGGEEGGERLSKPHSLS